MLMPRKKHWWEVNISLDNASVPSGTKPLPEPMLTQIHIANSRHYVVVCLYG